MLSSRSALTTSEAMWQTRLASDLCGGEVRCESPVAGTGLSHLIWGRKQAIADGNKSTAWATLPKGWSTPTLTCVLMRRADG